MVQLTGLETFYDKEWMGATYSWHRFRWSKFQLKLNQDGSKIPIDNFKRIFLAKASAFN